MPEGKHRGYQLVDACKALLPRGSGMTGCRDGPGLQVRIQRKAGWRQEVSHWRIEVSGCCGMSHSVSRRQLKRWASQSTGHQTGGATHAGSCGSRRRVAGGSRTAVALYTFSHTLFRHPSGVVFLLPCLPQKHQLLRAYCSNVH